MNTLHFLQHYWWALVSLLGAILVFLLFVQGLQSLLLRTASDKASKDLVVKYAGHKWEITFTTLVTFGGAAFASFPLFYSTSFGGAYWLWMAILFLFVVQAVSFEFRDAAGNLLGARTFEILLFLNGAFGSFLLGVAVATLFSGGSFVMEKTAITDLNEPAISYWTNGWHGLECLLNPFNLLLGFVVYFAARTLALLYVISKQDNDEGAEAFRNKCRRHFPISAAIFVLLFVVFALWLCLRSGYREIDGTMTEVAFAYWNTLWTNPWILIILLVGVVGVLFGIVRQFLQKGEARNFYWVGGGVVLAVWTVLLSAGFGGNAYFISTHDPSMSLTLVNSSSSLFTLRVMAVASIAIPFVIAYIAWAWRKMR